MVDEMTGPTEYETMFTPRAYQINLYEKAVQTNTILFLPTGSGKTYIAVMLLKHLSGDVRKPYRESGKRSIFAVNTVALVEQQAEYISRHTGLRCKGYSGDMQVDFWDEKQWSMEIEEHEVLVMTSQIFLNLLLHGYMKLNKVNLIIFDECHRAVANHPMRQIMQQFENCPVKDHPRVLAMSATLLNSNIKQDKIEPTIRSLEITFHAKIATVESTDCIEGYCTNPKEDIVKYENCPVPKVMEKITDIIETSIVVLKNVKLNLDQIYNESSEKMRPKTKSSKLIAILKDIAATALHAGIYGGSKSALLHLIQLESLRKYSDDQMTDHLLDYLITQVMLVRKLFDNEMKDYTELERLYKFSSDQIHKLFEILLQYKNNLDKQKFCCIIFVKERFMTQVIYHILKVLSAHDKQYNFISADYVLGFQNNPYKNSREVSCIAKWNKEVLQRFKSGSRNCIVSTDVVDEGIDIPTCTLIIRYDMPMDFRAYVQSKGRARHSTSSYIVLIPKDNSDFLQRYYQYINTESQLKRSLMGQSEQRTLPTQNDIMNDLYADFEIEPYAVKRNYVLESCLTEITAISLINMYCSSLLRSKFASLVPIWKLYEKYESQKLYMISLKLPNLAPVKCEVYGSYMKSIEGAKRSAAMNTCIKLHELGALTDKLLPANNEIMENLDSLFPNWVDEDNYFSGTYKKKREHALEHPLAFYGAYPQPEQPLYLHVLNCTSTYPTTGYDNRRIAFYNLLNDKSGFGILSTKSLPKIPSFPIFMKNGNLNVNVISDHTTIILSESDIELLKKFHFLLFSNIIPVIKSFMIFDNDNLENSFLIVPLNEKQEINWNIIKTYQSLELIPPCKPFHFRTSDYELALVTPTYRGSASVYVVTQVCDNLTPESLFPNEDFDTYEHYYKEKHGLIIENLDQSMLEVKPIPIKINYIKPRKIPEGPVKYKKTDDTVEDLQEHLVPELCLKINFPAVYWLKATTLPSIIHRICQYLIAEDLRITIAKETKLGMPIMKDELSSLNIEEDVEKLNEDILDYNNGLELTDDSIEKTQSDQTYSDSNFDFDCNPFLKDQEPRDLYRDMDHIQLIDIQYYNQFMFTNCDEDESATKNLKKKVGCYVERSTVSVPTLNALSSDGQSASQGPNSAEIMHALTTKLGSDLFNLERLETLGDSYLKFIVSLYLYHKYPRFNEGQLTWLKGKIIGNRNLYYCGTKKGISGRIKNDAFVPMSNFIPPAFTVQRQLQNILLSESVAPNVLYEFEIPELERFIGYISEDTKNKMMKTVMNWDKGDKQTGVEHYLGVQILSDKTVADSVEALIGVYLGSNGIKGAAKLLKWFGILPDIKIDKLMDSSSQNPVIGSGDPNYHMPWANTIETKFGYKFKNRAFLLQAFTHPSYSANGITECYQRLEFLGDAILDFLITCYIYENCGNLSPGELTDLRSALVNNITFACLAVRYGLHTALLAYAPKLNEIIDRFVKFQEERDFIVNDELLYVLIEEEECNLVEYVDVPKTLGDLFESLVGAIYLDTGKDLTKIWEIIYSLMHKEMNEFSRCIPRQPVRVIYENTDIRPKFLEAILIKGTGRVMIPLKVTIAGKDKLFHGFGINKRQAKCAAAKQALKRLQLEK